MGLALALTVLAAAPLAVPHVKQFKNGCGAASVAMVLQYWDRDRAPEHAAIYDALIDAERKGIQLARMKQYVEGAGYRAFTMRAKARDLEEQLGKGRPLIVALRSSTRGRMHFAVLSGIDGERVWLNDPTKNKTLEWRREKFEGAWGRAENWILLASPK
jgi:predicted double-glycine peptidase